jgi:4-hydroxyphenylacetate 3-monooxygenase
LHLFLKYYEAQKKRWKQMPVINGAQYISRIDQLHANVWYNGEKVKGNISEHPAFKGIMRSQARLFDLQVHPDTKNLLTGISEYTGKPVGTSYLAPKKKEDLEKRRLATQRWALESAGMLGRSPDYMNTALMALGTSSDLLKEEDERSAGNMLNYYKYAMENDLTLTHTFILPQVNRSQYYMEDNEKVIGARMIDQNEKGIIIHGARLLATQGATTDEILVFPSGARLPYIKASEAMSYAFAIPNNTPGLKFICRESFVGGHSTFDHPLSSRFEEMDTIVLFDHVLVPWDRVFLHGNIDVNNRIYKDSHYFPLTTHQIISKNITKVEFLLGLIQSMINEINIGEYQHIHEKVSEVIISLETLKGLVYSSEHNAEMSQWGVLIPDVKPLQVASLYFAKTYPRLIEIIKLIGASGLVSIPTEKDFQSEVGDDLRHYLQSAKGDGEEKVRLFRLAWDVSMSAFGSRQELYERYFFGDPVRSASQLYHQYDRDEYIKRVKNFLKNNDTES